jgi:hypothetical protein
MMPTREERPTTTLTTLASTDLYFKTLPPLSLSLSLSVDGKTYV